MALIDNLKLFAENKNLSNEKLLVFNNFLKVGFPTIKNEEWKYTSIKQIINLNYELSLNNNDINHSIIEEHSLGFKDIIIFSNGKLISFPEIEGVTISGFEDFQSNDTTAFELLNTSLCNSGFYIKIAENTIVENPVEILYFNSTENSFCQYRNNILVGKNSQVKFVEKNKDLTSEGSLTNLFTKITCGENSNVEYNKIQNNIIQNKLIDSMHISQKKDSVCDVNTLVFGGGFIRNNLNFEQNGENTESNMNGVSILNQNQFVDNHTYVDHKSPNCRSNELYKGIYLDNSTGVFNGKIMVRKDSQKIDAFQANNNLLLSDAATINSKPQLEIYADDVKCSHGCTIGQLDKEALFYMRSRGISLAEARAVLTFAFASDAINNLSIKTLKTLAKKLMAKKLNVDVDTKDEEL
jgi:Fe-S cluster assembly protein SufD